MISLSNSIKKQTQIRCLINTCGQKDGRETGLEETGGVGWLCLMWGFTWLTLLVNRRNWDPDVGKLSRQPVSLAQVITNPAVPICMNIQGLGVKPFITQYKGKCELLIKANLDLSFSPMKY